MEARRVGIVGAGNITSLHVPFWLTLGWEASVYALEGAQQLADQHGIDVCPSLESLFATVDVVDVCTSSKSHAVIALAAVQQDLPVVCEKPMALTFREALELAQMAERHGVTVLPAHVVRFFGSYETLHRAVRAGALGELAILRFVRGGSRPTSEWFLDERESGGIVFDLMIHDLDQASWLAGPVRRVHAVQSPAVADGRVPPEVVAHATLEHDSGAISHVQSFWGKPGFTFGPSFDVAGSSGRLVSSPGHEVTVFEDLPGLEEESSYLPPETAEESPYLSQLREFSQALHGGTPCRVSVWDGVTAVALAEAVRESIRSGEPVDFLPWRKATGGALSRPPLSVGVYSAAHGHAAGYLKHLRAHPDVTVSFTDPAAPPDQPDRGQHLAERVGARWVEDPTALLSAVDAVVICSENTRHHDDVKAALLHGCHVLCEKPMTTSVPDAVDLWRSADQAGLILGIAHPVRQSPAYRHLRARVESGAIGDVLSILGTNNGTLPRDRAWFVEPEWSGGGALVDHLVHCTDLVDGLLGRPAVRVRAATNRILEQSPSIQVETGGIVTVEYDGGVIASFDCSWSQPRTAPTWGGLTLDAIGTGGRVRIDPFNLRVAGHAAAGPQWWSYGSDMDAEMIGNFLAAIRGDASVSSPAPAGVRSVEIMVAALESARSGGSTVDVQPVTTAAT